jgi:hypothetical protein
MIRESEADRIMKKQTKVVPTASSELSRSLKDFGQKISDSVASCSRMVDLLESPLSKLMQREIIYRLLQSSQGDRLRTIATLGDQSHRTAKAVAWLRTNYEKPLREYRRFFGRPRMRNIQALRMTI